MKFLIHFFTLLTSTIQLAHYYKKTYKNLNLKTKRNFTYLLQFINQILFLLQLIIELTNKKFSFNRIQEFINKIVKLRLLFHLKNGLKFEKGNFKTVQNIYILLKTILLIFIDIKISSHLQLHNFIIYLVNLSETVLILFFYMPLLFIKKKKYFLQSNNKLKRKYLERSVKLMILSIAFEIFYFSGLIFFLKGKLLILEFISVILQTQSIIQFKKYRNEKKNNNEYFFYNPFEKTRKYNKTKKQIKRNKTKEIKFIKI